MFLNSIGNFSWLSAFLFLFTIITFCHFISFVIKKYFSLHNQSPIQINKAKKQSDKIPQEEAPITRSSKDYTRAKNTQKKTKSSPTMSVGAVDTAIESKSHSRGR